MDFTISRFVRICLLLLPTSTLIGQGSGVPLQSPSYSIYDRLDILGYVKNPIHPEIKSFNRHDLAQFAVALDSSNSIRLTRFDQADLKYLLNDNNEWAPDVFINRNARRRRGILKYLYPSPANFFEVNAPDFTLRANPMLHFSLGQDIGNGETVFQNQRGFEIRGEVDKRLFFYTNLIESQGRLPQYATERVDEFMALPGAGFFKPYDSRVFEARNAYDFNVATAYIGFQITRHFGVQLGHGKHFIGNGYRSMFLSDFGAPAFFLKFDTRVWKFHYQNLFLELSPVSQVNIPDGTILPKKYAAIHYLNLKLNPRLAFGFFEATVFNRSHQFEFQYLNPVIVYRTVEGMIGSPDNVLLGMDMHWNIFKRFQVYGQLLLDELVASEVLSGSGWWANKWGIQAGAKYINLFGLDHLDLQVEHNRARPYTYAHYDSANSYTHYNQPLAHPLGANFEETVLLLRWQTLPRLTFQARYLFERTGENTALENWGNNPLLDYSTRVQDYGNEVGQGVTAKVNILGLDITWALWHNVFLDFKALYRRKESLDNARNRTTQLLGLGLRMNMWSPNLDF